jgi:hypothetical protein
VNETRKYSVKMTPSYQDRLDRTVVSPVKVLACFMCLVFLPAAQDLAAAVECETTCRRQTHQEKLNWGRGGHVSYSVLCSRWTHNCHD